jgi:hypothetical protein
MDFGTSDIAPLPEFDSFNILVTACFLFQDGVDARTGKSAIAEDACQKFISAK